MTFSGKPSPSPGGRAEFAQISVLRRRNEDDEGSLGAGNHEIEMEDSRTKALEVV